MKIKNTPSLVCVLTPFIAIFMIVSCEREFDISKPILDLKIYKIEAGVKTEITSAKVGDEITFSKLEESVTDFNRNYHFAIWTGDEGHEFDKIYQANQLGTPFNGLEYQYVYDKAGTYQVVYVVSLYNLNSKELERDIVSKTIRITN
ncbi:MAG: hypothetical protein VW080_10425 [Flavobacteriaceae bacterium]